jgi:hypothetical protein
VHHCVSACASPFPVERMSKRLSDAKHAKGDQHGEATREPCEMRTHHNHTWVLGGLPRLLPGLGLLVVQHTAGERACESAREESRHVRAEIKR